ncbi:hypothetical protein HYALB_00004900 [Hymenoscyphus albidus]|uniref:Uncharacterized protein n=1 Tax=Hymenoscyphus albidus TaxID=595503 RepID=A0A9N9LI92_9HELO|nr:hypothetical protein HYALB_00004900 [Hymenoscyphus albidus]
MVADSSEIVILSPKYSEELKDDHRLDFVKLFLQDFHEGIPGFDFADKGARDAKLLRQVTKKELTHQLGLCFPYQNPKIQSFGNDNLYRISIVAFLHTEYHTINTRTNNWMAGGSFINDNYQARRFLHNL